MKVLKLIFKNALRHKLRTVLTILGITIAVVAFGLLRTVVTIWDSSVDAAAANRLITRQAVSFIFPLPYSYFEKIKNIEGVQNVSFANWFGGIYKDKNNFFARLADRVSASEELFLLCRDCSSWAERISPENTLHGTWLRCSWITTVLFGSCKELSVCQKRNSR